MFQVGDKVYKGSDGKTVWTIIQINIGSCDTVAILDSGKKTTYRSVSKLRRAA